MKSKFSRQNTKKILAGLLAFWMSGVVLLFCCEMPQTMASEIESCPLAKISHCDKTLTSESVSQFASFQADNQKLDCCRFLPNIFDKAQKVEATPQIAEVAITVKVLLPKFSSTKTKFYVPTIYRPFVLSRGDTYLKNRIFRI